MADPADRLAAELERLRGVYREHLPAQFAEMAELVARLPGDGWREALSGLHHRLHKLAGSAGSFGFEALSAQARELEDMANAWLLDAGARPEPAALSAFAERVGRLAALV